LITSEVHVRTDILAFSDAALQQEMEKLGWQRFRSDQLISWLWEHGVRSFEEMTNLSKQQRQELNERYYIPRLVTDKVQYSTDGTVKFRFKLHDGYMIESVLIPVDEEERYTVCVSSQAGCSLTCKFCATGQMGLLRNLTASEIFDQYTEVNRCCQERYGRKLSNIVFMGMGEPLLNYKQVVGAIRRLSSAKGPGLSPRRMTVSTAGIAKMIVRLADEDLKVNLALSLHAADDDKRSTMMPINEYNDLQSLMSALKYFNQKTGNKISYEYIAFAGFNDQASDARNLVRLCSHFPVMVNVIEYNPVRGSDYEKSSEDQINQFAKMVREQGVMITVRRSRGKDIDAACGQLANQEQNPISKTIPTS